jgi:glycosyltransferase involved in cell wall biosynthesis
MLENKNVAFYAPIKPPDHHIPSGDRLIAQNIFKALEMSGVNVELASRYIAYSKRHDETILVQKKQGAEDEAEILLKAYTSRAPALRPQIWLTYHPYCKAPDWIGPIVSKALNIPYVTIEAAKTGQGGAEDLWKPWREEAQAGIRQADLHLVFKPTDEQYLCELLGSQEKLVPFSPFIDAENIDLAQPMELPQHWDRNTPVLITTGMMRKGKKLDNFHILAKALTNLGADFNLIVVGGGPEEMAVRQAFSSLDEGQIHWTGMVEHSDVLRWMRSSDVFIWPGWKEPIGMVYLEAQLQELPVLAYKSMGVPLVVANNETGLLAPEDDLRTLKDNTIKLLQDAHLRNTMGKKGRIKVLTEHGIQAASNRLAEILAGMIEG